ncbi:PEP-CTERM sorting domain-containing protein [Paucibacter sp. KBW04]|uniref:PEP-CTERM sorting domain-containing protein n=1 Tax=Paucibacter sp. KBW04 TaxID=2153361 RepID=UPI0018CBFCFD|nr:PEP-CTERM sorting domain-containing protein [Paucibacter sp. KBW04]
MPDLKRPSMLQPLALACTLCAALAASASAQAASQTYTSLASFLAAAGTVKTETFNAFTVDQSGGGSPLMLSDFAVQGAWTLDAPATRLPSDGSSNLFIDVSYGAWADLRFAEPIKAFGAWFSRAPASIRVDADSLEGFGSYRHVGEMPIAAGTDLQFIGFSSDQTFNRIVFEGQGCCSGSFAIDDVAYAASLSPVPEPGAWALLATGLLALGLRRRSATTPRN